jgi:hypothetical protein
MDSVSSGFLGKIKSKVYANSLTKEAGILKPFDLVEFQLLKFLA